MHADPDQDGYSDDELLTGEAVALDVQPVGFVLRVVGALLDGVLLTVLWILVLGGLSYLGSLARVEEAVYYAFAIVALVLAYVIAPMILEAATRGKSVGKYAIGGRIVRDDGGAIGLRHAAIRALVGILELPLGLAALTGLLAPRTKRLGDLLAGTYSRYERLPSAIPPVFGLPPSLASWARVADVARLPDPLARRIAQFLASASQFEPGRRTHLAREIAAETAAYVAPVPVVDAELFLAGVVVVRRDREFRALELERRRLETLRPALTGTPHDFPARG
jgi:uncharacterized RDD family membrane protein YckC